MIRKRKLILLILSLLFIIILINIVFGIPDFNPYGTTSYLNEDDSVFTYNFSANVTDPDNATAIWNFTILGINSTLYSSQTLSSFYYWFSINPATGILTINTTRDNQTGRFNLSVQVLDQNFYGGSKPFYFIVNASNDYPNITSINNSYNMSASVNFMRYVNATDEENQWPLLFSLTFYDNCTKRPWNNRSDCNIFNITNVTNSSAIMNFTSSKYDAGVYWANISVRDYGANYSCNSSYCLANYSENRTYFYPQIIEFNVYTYLEVNATDCKNKIFQENQSGTCWINITSREYGDNITYMSNATLRNGGYVSNASWFFFNWSNYTSNYTDSILINITPGKTSIGNWTINFSAADINYSESSYDLMNITVNKTLNDLPRLASIPNVIASTSALFRVNITVYDDDNLIPDKLTFNETMNFTINITNASNFAQSFNFSAFNFTVQILNYFIAGTNRTEGKIELTPNSTLTGNFSVNITATDKDGANVSTGFNLSVKNNLAPLWNESLVRIFTLYEHNNTYLNLSQNITDPNPEDGLNFTFSSNSYFPSFDINRTTGIINFTANDSDVGFHIVTINVSDGYLTNSTTFNFTILNVNETPVIRRPVSISGTGTSGNSGTEMNSTEDSSATITMYVEDSDLGITTEQKSYYNENLTINTLTISVGPNSSLFNFNTIIIATNNTNFTTFSGSFTPKKADVGTYTVFINVSDKTNFSDSISFTLNINPISHSPEFSVLTNQTTAVNRTASYRINSTDTEDGNSTTPGNGNFTFSYLFLNGADFINNNQSIFNSTTGLLNYTFNSSQGGRYRLNITVTDTSGLNSSTTFWIFVYNVPNITSPATNYQFSNIFENSSYSFNFSINQSIQDNVTCEIYTETINGNILRNNLSVYGNNTNFTWNLAANFTDETYGLRNLTIIAYPATNNLENAIDLNITKRWNITINHTNAPLLFSGIIPDLNKTITGGSPQYLYLSNYFSDIDASDIYHNQTITFSYSTISISGAITVNISNWINTTIPTMTFSSDSASSANYTITAFELNESNSSHSISNVSSNNFRVDLSVSTVATPSTSSGGSGSSSTTLVPYALKLIVPSKISGYINQKIIVPLRLINSGKETFKNINVSALAFKNGSYENIVKVSFDKISIASLAPGKTEDITMTLLFNTSKTGDYEVTVSAESKSPSYTDWAKIYLNLQKINESEVRKFILFTEEYIVQNPSCLELKERINEAEKAMENEDYSTARAIAENVLNTCKEHVEKPTLPSEEFRLNYKILQYLTIAIILSIFAGVGYYFIKRRGYRKNSVNVKNSEINSRV